MILLEIKLTLSALSNYINGLFHSLIVLDGTKVVCRGEGTMYKYENCFPSYLKISKSFLKIVMKIFVKPIYMYMNLLLNCKAEFWLIAYFLLVYVGPGNIQARKYLALSIQ